MRAVLMGGAILVLLVSAGSCSDSSDTSGGSGGTGGEGTSTTASSSATGAAGAGGEGGAGGEPLCSGMMLSGRCDPVAQDCAMGERCVVDPLGSPATSCIPLGDGDNYRGSYCESHDDCVPGAACIGDVCTSYCCIGDDSPCNGWSCDFVMEVGEQSIGLCSFEVNCTLFDGDSCPPGHVCVWRGDNRPHCMLPGSGLGQSEACRFVGECDAGLYCINSTCEYFCDTSASGAAVTEGGCPPGQSCQAVDVEWHSSLGICTL